MSKASRGPALQALTQASNADTPNSPQVFQAVKGTLPAVLELGFATDAFHLRVGAANQDGCRE